MVVVTTVVEVPEPRVYVRTTDDPSPPAAPVGAEPELPVERGMVGAEVVTAPPAELAMLAE